MSLDGVDDDLLQITVAMQAGIIERFCSLSKLWRVSLCFAVAFELLYGELLQRLDEVLQ